MIAILQSDVSAEEKGPHAEKEGDNELMDENMLGSQALLQLIHQFMCLHILSSNAVSSTYCRVEVLS